MQHLLSMCLLTSLAAELVPERETQPCGGRLKGPYGIIQTPNFPNAFPVPIKCKWIISHDLVNGTISIYFTQQYATSGLSFTEYLYYDDSYKLGERRAFHVTEENITKVKSIQVQSPVLVVELALPALEGTQLRALGLLAVFGLNITYAVTAPAPAGASPATPAASCSALECRLLGHCYATHDYQSFFCLCFEGYSGADCGVGAACASSVCLNGGTCRQLGPAAVECICAPGYTGDFCETHTAPPDCSVAECGHGCQSTTCDCNARNNDHVSALSRFETELQVLNEASTNIIYEISKQITEYLNASNIHLDGDIQILNISSLTPDGARVVWVRIWADQSFADALQKALVFFSATGSRTHQVRLMPATLHVVMKPALNSLTLTVSNRKEIWEGSEYVLTCTADGSKDIVFTWFKDGVKINFNGTTRDMWTKTMTEVETGQTVSTLEVTHASHLDTGRWSCLADDAGRRRCRALWLTVLRPPDIRLIPSTVTVNKGDNVTITCLTNARKAHGILGFSWAQDRSLLRLAPGRAVWEDLYPAGSVLKLYNVQKSGEFLCQISSIAGTNANIVTMWVLGAGDEACDADGSHDQQWPRTAPGAHAVATCPLGYQGVITRFCEPKTIQHGVKWGLPDFSQCIASQLKIIYDEFVQISHGLSWNSVTNITRRYESALRLLSIHPGEGTVPLHHTREMIHYLLSKAQSSDREGSVEYLLKIFDILLKHPDNFLDEAKVYDLQKAVVLTAAMKNTLDLTFQEFSIMSRRARDYKVASFKLQSSVTGNVNWYIASVEVELAKSNKNGVVVAARYNNLAARLPSLKSSIELRDGAEMEYLVASQHIQLLATGDDVDCSQPHMVTLIFSHVHNYSAIVSKLACGLRSSLEPRAWITRVCEVRVPEPFIVACQCQGIGTFALFTVARSTLTQTERDLRGVVKVTVGVGGALCLVATALQMLSLVSNKNSRLPVLLKAATAGTHSAAMFTLLECDTRQESGCDGTWGWLCALCWCAGSAALCAQPLLLQAELAARASSAPAVALLAGVCTLSWLTARLCGGAPLQLGTAAQVVCAAACALLVVLCFSLAVCAALRLSSINHKITAERVKYLKDRRRIVRNTLVLLLTTSAVQAAGVAYAQPGERQTTQVVALAVAAIANGIAMVMCYVICDEDCVISAKHAISLTPPQNWDDNPAGDTSLSLYIKQIGEVDSRGGVDIIESSSIRVSPTDSYWRAPGLESPDRNHRRQSVPDTRADIVRCVEYAEISHHARLAIRPPCDLVPCASPAPPCHPPLFIPPPAPPPHTSPHDGCSVCTRSTPDVSTPAEETTIKSCLKKTADDQLSSSISLPTLDYTEESRTNLDIEHVNREWNKAYSSPDTEKVLNKISSDLDFLLNRTLEKRKDVLDEIEEAPT